MNLIKSALYGPTAHGLDIIEIIMWILRYSTTILIIVNMVSITFQDMMTMTIIRDSRRRFWQKFILKCVILSAICSGLFTIADIIVKLYSDNVVFVNILSGFLINLINLFFTSLIVVVLEIFFGKKVAFSTFYFISTISAVLVSTAKSYACWMPGSYGMMRIYNNFDGKLIYINICIQILVIIVFNFLYNKIIDYRIEHPEKITK